jgi:RNA polymerase sigma-70 factor (ECF subfamily)
MDYKAKSIPAETGVTKAFNGAAERDFSCQRKPGFARPNGIGLCICNLGGDGAAGVAPGNQLELRIRFHGILHPDTMAIIETKVKDAATDELALVQAAKSGNVAAFEELVKRYDRNIFRIAQHITQNREDAEDVVQDAFLKAYENLEQFQGNSKFYTWLVRIAVNESLMKLRRRRSDRTVSLDEDIETEEDSMPREVADWSPNPEQLYKQGELKDILRKTVQGLPASFRTVFVLRDVEGLSTEETAEALDLSIPAVKSRLLRARLQLRERLNKFFRKPRGGDGKT